MHGSSISRCSGLNEHAGIIRSIERQDMKDRKQDSRLVMVETFDACPSPKSLVSRILEAWWSHYHKEIQTSSSLGDGTTHLPTNTSPLTRHCALSRTYLDSAAIAFQISDASADQSKLHSLLPLY